jgi:hypothetical protein
MTTQIDNWDVEIKNILLPKIHLPPTTIEAKEELIDQSVKRIVEIVQEQITLAITEERKRIVEEIEKSDCFYCYERGEREDGLLMKRKDVGEFKRELINKIK